MRDRRIHSVTEVCTSASALAMPSVTKKPLDDHRRVEHPLMVA